jgi:hypothetical protein
VKRESQGKNRYETRDETHFTTVVRVWLSCLTLAEEEEEGRRALLPLSSPLRLMRSFTRTWAQTLSLSLGTGSYLIGGEEQQ